MPSRQSSCQRSVSVGVPQRACYRGDRRRPARSRSQQRQPLTVARAETRQEFRRLVAHLRVLHTSVHTAVANVATATLQRLPRNADRLDARTFDRVLFAIRNHRDALPLQHQHGWIVVEGLATMVFHALLRRFRAELARRSGAA